jgi:hypothetical protein
LATGDNVVVFCGGVLGGGVEAADEEEEIEGGVDANVDIGLVASPSLKLLWLLAGYDASSEVESD